MEGCAGCADAGVWRRRKAIGKTAGNAAPIGARAEARLAWQSSERRIRLGLQSQAEPRHTLDGKLALPRAPAGRL